ncbi:MAG: hypothetical protein LBQ55_05135 [Treponema sp.]|jgi:hypothetical protein|nr:hypothetical protein [Treponema sp.]
MENPTKESGLWFNILDAALKIPGSKIDREVFLQNEYGKYCDQKTVDKILRVGSVNANVELTLMEKMAADIIKQHAGIATTLSFAAGVPGGLAMAATIPADIAQFYYHVIIAAQKLAYVFGLLSIEEDKDSFYLTLTVFMGVMAGIEEADKKMNELLMAQFAKKLGRITMGKILDKTVTRIAITIGLQLTKRNVFKAVLKTVPIIGGLVSGGITLLSFLPMCNNLKNKFCYSIIEAKKNNIILL